MNIYTVKVLKKTLREKIPIYFADSLYYFKYRVKTTYPQYGIVYMLHAYMFNSFISISERTGSGLLLRSTRESETRILPSRTTVCNTNPYLAATFSFLRTPRDTTANCRTSASSTGLPRFHVKL